MFKHGVAPACDLTAPGRMPHGPGWYLAAVNQVTEAGPFPSRTDAEAAGRWLDDTGRGVNPAPYKAFYSPRGVTVGIRRKDPTTFRRTA